MPENLYLNVGAGAYPLEGFVNLDNSPYFTLLPLAPILKPLIGAGRRKLVEEYERVTKETHYRRHDCRKRLPYPDNSVDHIHTNHFLEHVYRDEAERIVRDFYRVLKPGHIAHVSVPSFSWIVGHYCKERDADAAIEGTALTFARRPTLRYRVMELLGFEGLQHRWLYDQKSLERLLTSAGFVMVTGGKHPSSHLYDPEAGHTVHALGRKP